MYITCCLFFKKRVHTLTETYQFKSFDINKIYTFIIDNKDKIVRLIKNKIDSNNLRPVFV